VISGFRREVDENCALLGYYAAIRGNFIPTFQGQKMEGALVKLNPGLPWEKLHLKRRRIFLPANWT